LKLKQQNMSSVIILRNICWWPRSKMHLDDIQWRAIWATHTVNLR